MPQLTKEQRNVVYREARAELNTDLGREFPYMCNIIGRIVLKSGESDGFNFKDYGFIEILNKRPNPTYARSVWWPTSDLASRLSCLDQCIEETNP